MGRKLYSYLRWSSAVQASGTSKARQVAAAEKYAREHDLEMIEIIDPGVSAFRGANAKSGALGQFLDAVDQGLIPSNAFLFVEQLDRLTRGEVDVALELFMGVLRRGITIVTGMDNKVYTRAGIKENPIDLLTSILMFVRANEESRTKQNRTNGNALALIKRFQDGLPTTIKSIGSHPWWIDDSSGSNESVRKDPVLWPVAQYAIECFLEGMSVFKVTQLLNEKYYHLYKGKAWSYANVRKLRINPAVYGMRVLTVDEKKFNLPGYFPALISEGQYLRLQKIRETTKYIGKVGEQTNNINLLAGLRIFRCGHCGGTMMAMRHKNTIRYLCEKGRGNGNDCKTWSLPGILVEHTLMLVTTIAYLDLQLKGKSDKSDYTHQINNIESLIQDISTRISRGTTLILNGLGDVEEVVTQIKELEAQRNNLTLELEVLQRKQILANDDTFESLMMDFFTYAQYGVLHDPVHEYRNKLRDIVRSSIGDVRAWKVNRRLYLSFQIKGHEDYYNFSAGATPYEWGCHLGPLPFTDDAQTITEALKVLPDERLTTLVNRYTSLNRSAEAMLEQAKEMLRVVGYPELDSKLFWPKK